LDRHPRPVILKKVAPALSRPPERQRIPIPCLPVEICF
jgi:hypothetical protein